MALHGIFPIVATPFDGDDEIDLEALRRVTRFCLDCGVQGVVWPALASEFYALSESERTRALPVVVDEVQGRATVIAGVAGASAKIAERLTREAVVAGADAAMALTPYIVKEDQSGLERYYRAICAAAEGRPVILQNVDAPFGQALSASVIASLVERVPGIRYVKEETLPSGHAIRNIRNACGDQLDGVFGGGGGRYLIEEHHRGACGAMPACDFSDVFVALWDHLENQRHAEAYCVFERLLPLLMTQATMRMAFINEVLRARGILEGTMTRLGRHVQLDDVDRRELERWWLRLDEVFDSRKERGE